MNPAPTKPKMIFVNLPVANVEKSTAFYEAIGARRDPRFCDNTASCMVFSETIHAMLLSHDKYRQFTAKKIADAHAVSEVLIAVSEESRADVDVTLNKALAAGGREPRPPQDYGFMFGRSFEDPDGHVWEVIWMDVDAYMAAREAQPAA